MHAYPRLPRRLHLPALLACTVFFAALLAGAGMPAATPARAQSTQNAMPDTCQTLTAAFSAVLQYDTCLINVGDACYLNTDVVATPYQQRRIVFAHNGDVVALDDVSQLATRANAGATYLLGGTAANPVKIIVFGDSRLGPQPGNPAGVFTLRGGSSGPICDRTRSGAILQTPRGQRGAVVVNRVLIRLESTAYIAVGGDLLYDQDPRLDRRSSAPNAIAPLCSGFDSDCAFGDTACRPDQRLVWGPFCRQDAYPAIETGLYRVTLDGSGRVTAGATDAGATDQLYSLGRQDLQLPGSYTFCWQGLAPGGTGFETVVQPLSTDAAVRRITVEYLGRDCTVADLVGSESSRGSDLNGLLNVMTVYNLEGNVVVAAGGAVRTVLPGERVRVYYSGDKPIAVDPSPLPAAYFLRSPLLATTQAMALAAPPAPRSALLSGPNALLAADLGQLTTNLAGLPGDLTALEPVTITRSLVAVTGQGDGGSSKGSSSGGQGNEIDGQGDGVTPVPGTATPAPLPPLAPVVPPPILMPLGPGYPP